MADTDNGNSSETVVTQPLKNDASAVEQPTTPSKEENQANMRLAQENRELAQKLEKIQKDKEAADRKQLEEKEEYRTLYEKEKAEREHLAEEQATAEKSRSLKTGTDELLGKFPQTVQEIAAEAGLSLSDTTDEAKADLTKRLEAIKSRVGAKVTSNNPNVNDRGQTTEDSNRDTLVQTMRLNNVSSSTRKAAMRQAVHGLSAMDAMRKESGLQTQEV